MVEFKGFLKRKKTHKEIALEEERAKEIRSYVDEPGRAASIVAESIDSGNYSDIQNKLEELPSTGYHRTQYVFATPKTTIFNWIIVISLCFMVGYLYFAVMAVGMHMYSDKYDTYSTLFLGSTAAVIIINVMLIVRAVNTINFAKRYEKYVELFKYKNIEIIDDINNYTKLGYSRIVKDLSKAVHQKLIPEGHFTSENLVFIASDELYSKYEENKPEYDRYYKQLIEERARIEERSDEIQKILDIGNEYLEKIQNSNQLIKDKDITEKLNKMEKIVATIFREVDINPEQSGKLSMFLNYYLPTTEKLLTTYIDIAEKKIEGVSIRNSKKEIEHGLDMLIESFEGILNQFYEEQEMDIVSDVAAMEAIMTQGKNGR